MNNIARTMRFSVRCGLCLLVIALPGAVAAQDSPSMQLILDRLSRLEHQNEELMEEIRALRGELAELRGEPLTKEAAGPTLDERLSVVETRVEEQAQTKVEVSQRFPIRLTGMALVNAFSNSRHNGGRDNPTTASLDPEPRTSGGTIRQSVIGLDYRGPTVAWGGKVIGSLFMDFYSGPGDSLNQYFRIRTGSIRVDWKNRSVTVGQEKPLISPREPNSLAQVGVSPLTNAGNLWLWQPQVRFEQRLAPSDTSLLRAQVAVYQTRERAAYVPDEYGDSVEAARPALQGRFEFSHTSPSGFRIEAAPGFHVAASHVAGASVPSRLVTLDWFLKPAPRIEFTGMLFAGRNVAGLGALRQGFRIRELGRVDPVGSVGGWSQLTFLPTRRITLNLFGGQQDDRNSDLPYGGFDKNQAYGANLMFRIAPNTILSFENLRTWTTYVRQGSRHNNHYDLAIAYLF